MLINFIYLLIICIVALQPFIYDTSQLPLIRILANFIGLSKNHTPSLTYTQSGDAQNISLPIKSELIREESIPG